MHAGNAYADFAPTEHLPPSLTNAESESITLNTPKSICDDLNLIMMFI